ncbi:MAG TPA: PH domain-containing protein [Anaerolineales bacterium]|nr:PH domain-containing protein [Anaerolineales bacterium]
MNAGLFPPSKRRGLLLHGVLIVILLAISGWGFFNLSRSNVGPNFVLFLLVGLIAFAPIPFFVYRAYALLRAEYILDRNSLEIRWGLRDENIPLTDIEWVRSANDLTNPLGLPPVRMPGAVLGLRRHPDLGMVEFIASDIKNLLLVATAKRVYAISPARALEFTQTFARSVELGSLSPTEGKSVYPSFIVSEAWGSGLNRYLWLAALFLNLGLFVWVSLLIPSFPKVALGFRPDHTPDTVPSAQLIILPLISTFLALAGWGAGLYFYRWNKERVLSVIIWASSALASLMFLIAVLFIITTPI